MRNLITTTSKNYMRDEQTHALLNTNDIEYQNIIVLRNRNKQLHNVENELKNLKNEMDLIKQLLTKENK